MVRAPRVAGTVARPGIHRCIGCGRRASPEPHSYCRICRVRMRMGVAVDVDDYVTCAEVRRLRVLFPDETGARRPHWHRRKA